MTNRHFGFYVGGDVSGSVSSALRNNPDPSAKITRYKWFSDPLVLDRNGNGTIDNGAELFGAVRIWRDTNADGISQADELKTLIDSGVASITLASTASGTKYGDATLARALQEAATLNPNLVGLVQQAQSASTKAGFRDAVSNMLLAWGSESAYVSASDVALTHGYGVIESEPRNAQEEGWLDMAVKASTADRDAFRAGLSAGDLTKFDAMGQRMVGMSFKTKDQDSFAPTCRRAAVPTGLRARGRGACDVRNWSRPSGTGTRHARRGRCAQCDEPRCLRQVLHAPWRPQVVYALIRGERSESATRNLDNEPK